MQSSVAETVHAQPTACAHPAHSAEPLFPACDYITGDSFAIHRCAACGLVRTQPVPAAGAMHRYYPSGYYGEGDRYGSPIEQALTGLYAVRARLLTLMAGGKPGRVLDIGCGRGALLHELRRLGWEVAGTELSEESARYARQTLRLPVWTGPLAEQQHPAASYDAVVLWHVLEHVPDPAAVLGEVARLLRPGGVLLVAVPNFASIEAQRGKAHWFHLDVPRHLNHFTDRSLRAALAASGLKPRATSYFAAEYDYFSAVQTALNMLGLRHNLLYNLLRARGAKPLAGADRVPVAHVLLALLLAPPLSVASALWAPLAALLHRGATVTVYAQKSIL